MNPENTGSVEPVSTPTPTEPTNQPAPASSPEPTPAPAAQPPAEGQEPPASAAAPNEPTPPAEPAAAQPEPPRESAMQRRAREAREKANGLLGLANKLDPQGQPAAPAAPQAPAAAPLPAQPQTQPEPPDYFDPDDGTIDPAKLAAYNSRETARQVALALAARDATQAQKANQETLRTEVSNYADRVQTEADYLSNNVPELNPKDPAYDKALDDFIEADYKEKTTDSQGRLIRVDVSLQAHAEKIIEQFRRARTNGQAAIPNAQVAAGMDGAITPGAGQAAAPGGKSVEQMSPEEYEAHLIKNGTKVVRR